MSEVFGAAYRAARVGSDALELVPTWLSIAGASVLPVGAAGISVFNTDFRVPIGASGPDAAAAERLQFTTGQGPCLDTHATGGMVLATETELAARWPIFHEQLRAATPYRAVACVPLPGVLAGVGTMDLYLHRSPDLASLPLPQVSAVAALVADTLAIQPWVPTLTGATEPGWLRAPGARARGLVSVAMGMLSVAARLSFEDALEVLRVHAYASDRTVDEVAAAVVHGDLPIQDLHPHSDS